MLDISIHISIGIIASFLGALPFGVLNLTMLETVIKKGKSAGNSFAFGSSIFEILQAFVAIWFLEWFLQNQQVAVYFNYAAIPILIILGIVYLVRDPECKKKSVEFKSSCFLKSIYLSFLNPIAIPFWVFYAGYFHSLSWIGLSTSQIIFFVIGVGIGKFLAMYLYGYAGKKILIKLNFLNFCFNRFFASIFILLAIVQGARMLFF